MGFSDFCYHCYSSIPTKLLVAAQIGSVHIQIRRYDFMNIDTMNDMQAKIDETLKDVNAEQEKGKEEMAHD